uniref:Uncharacterized protein n=1 Tax=Lygus hesperus TaxID=30085 RepID=A0A0A9XGK9_LYGHE
MVCVIAAREEQWSKLLAYLPSLDDEEGRVRVIEQCIQTSNQDTVWYGIQRFAQHTSDAVFVALHRQLCSALEKKNVKLDVNYYKMIQIFWNCVSEQRSVVDTTLGVPLLGKHDVCLHTVNQVLQVLVYDGRMDEACRVLQH